jgi:hypothetical protein
MHYTFNICHDQPSREKSRKRRKFDTDTAAGEDVFKSTQTNPSLISTQTFHLSALHQNYDEACFVQKEHPN